MGAKEVLEDICSEECDGRYCILKEFLKHSGFNERQLKQIKCVEKFKYELGVREKRPFEWEEAWDCWVKDGYAARFSRAYSPNIGYKEIYKRIFIDKTEDKTRDESIDLLDNAERKDTSEVRGFAFAYSFF